MYKIAVHITVCKKDTSVALHSHYKVWNWPLRKARNCRTRKHTPLVHRPADLWVGDQPGLQSEFQDSQGLTEKHCLEKPTERKKKEREENQELKEPYAREPDNEKLQSSFLSRKCLSRITAACGVYTIATDVHITDIGVPHHDLLVNHHTYSHVFLNIGTKNTVSESALGRASLGAWPDALKLCAHHQKGSLIQLSSL